MIPRVSAAILAVLLALSLAACSVANNDHLRVGSAPYLQGSGNATSETRQLGDFHAITATQGITVFVSGGDAATATVSGDDNLLDHITTEVTDGTLVIAIDGSLETRNPLKVEVAAASPIDAIAADAGSTLDAEDLEVDSLEVRATSGSTVRGGGRTEALSVAATTGSTIDLRNVEATQAQVEVSVGSTAHVRATGAVSGSCTMGSTLQLYGPPATTDVASDAGSTVKD
jgi:hypothetical protein